MHDDAVHEVSKAPGMELSGTGTMVVAVVKCKLVELCLTSAFAPGKPKLPEQSWLIKLTHSIAWARSESRGCAIPVPSGQRPGARPDIISSHER